MSALPSTLESVIVYREGACCRRVAQVPAGTRTVRLAGLPLSLEPTSLRARVVNGVSSVIEVRPNLDVHLAAEAELSSEQVQLEAAERKLAGLNTQAEQLDGELEQLGALRPEFLPREEGAPPRPAITEALLGLATFQEAEVSMRQTKRRTLARELENAEAEVTLLRGRVMEASTSKRTERAKITRVAEISFVSPLTQAAQLELEYVVPGARWTPRYSLQLERGMTGGVLRLNASVAQNTGEDWAQVKLSLSTAVLQRRADMPVLKALKVGRRQAAPPSSGWRAPPPGLDSLFEAYDEAMGPPANDATRLGAPGGGFGGPPPRKQEAPEQVKLMKKSGAARRDVPMMAQRASIAAAPPPPPPAAAPQMSRSRSKAQDVPEAEPPMEMMSALQDAYAEKELAFADEGDTGTFQVPAASGLDDRLADYGQLIMVSPADGGASRGRLSQAANMEWALVASMNVRIDIVMDVVLRAQHGAQSVRGLPLPARCVPVNSVSAFDYRYDCSAPADIASTGTWVSVSVAQCDVGLTPEYVCVPAVEAQVYRTLAVANRSSHALLPGPVDVTAGDQFLMTTMLPTLAPGASDQRLGLGVEEAIKVARRTKANETTGGFLGGSTVLPHEIEVELQNRLSSPAVIEVRERVPTPDASEKDLKLEEGTIDPPWERIEDPIEGRTVRGARRWRIRLDPGAKKTLSAQFSIRIPADQMLVGGNRRS